MNSDWFGTSAKYVVQVLKKMQTDQIRKVDVKKRMQDAFNRYTQHVHQDLVWSGSCQSWCEWQSLDWHCMTNAIEDKDRESGWATAVWPGSSIHYMEMIDSPRWEDFDIEYTNVKYAPFPIFSISQL